MRDSQLQTEPDKRPSILRPAAKILLTAVVVYFVGRQFAAHWQDIKDHDWSIDPTTALISIALGLLTLFLMSTIWRMVIAGFGHRLRAAQSFRIFYLSDLGRYIPGKVWQLAGILYLARQQGVPPERAGASFVLIQLFAIPASFLLYSIAAQFEPGLGVDQVAFLGQTTAYAVTAVLLLLCLLMVLWPRRMLLLVNRLLARLKRPPVELQLDKRVALGVFLGYCVAWTLYGTAFWLLLRAAFPDAEISWLVGVGAFNAAYQVGYLTLFAPGGLGPRELVMSVLMAPYLGPLASAAAVLARVWALVVEVTAALIALGIRK